MTLRTLFVSGAIVAAPLLVVSVIFGSVANFAGWLRGELISALPLDVGVVTLKQGERLAVPIKLLNRTDREIAVSGASVSCGCVDLQPLPLVMKPGWSTTVLHFSSEGLREGEHQFSVDFHFNVPSRPVRSFLNVRIIRPGKKPLSSPSDELKPVPVDAAPKRGS